VALGSIVMADVPPNSIMAGNPARQIQTLPASTSQFSGEEPPTPIDGLGDQTKLRGRSVVGEDAAFAEPGLLAEHIRGVVSKAGGLEPDFDSKANLYLDLGVPSTAAIQILMELEERLGLQ